MPKRKASSYNAASGRRYAGGSAGSRRAAAIGARLAARYPYAGYGRMYVPKGTATALAGESYRAANAEQRAWRRANNYTGVGGFWGSAWKKMKSLGKAHGAKALGYLGGAVLGPEGAALGSAAGHAMGLGAYRMGGLGAYGEISNNDIVHGGSGDSMAIAQVNPSMSDDSGDVVMSHSEFIGNVVATATLPPGVTTIQSSFQNSVYPINPGLQGSFPFLCQLSQNYTMYKLEGLIYQYKPTSGEGGGGSNQLGKIIMATDYDPMAMPFINSVQMENYQYSQSTKPSLAARHGVECAPSQGITDMKYVRTGLSNRDKSFTDYGLFQIATEGIPVTGAAGTNVAVNIGELWVSYKVRLSRANLYSSLLGYSIRSDLFDFKIPANVPVTAGDLLNNQQLVVQNNTATNNIGCTINVRAGFGSYPDTITVVFPVSQILGVYKITVQTQCDSVDVISQQNQWAPMQPGASTESLGTDKTQWGCTFTPISNFCNDAKTTPQVDLNTGLPLWVDSSQTGMRKMSYFVPRLTDSADPIWSSTSTYFAINSPTTSISKSCFGFYQWSTANPPVYTGQVLGRFLTADTDARIRVFVEQVNAEISN